MVCNFDWRCSGCDVRRNFYVSRIKPASRNRKSARSQLFAMESKCPKGPFRIISLIREPIFWLHRFWGNYRRCAWTCVLVFLFTRCAPFAGVLMAITKIELPEFNPQVGMTAKNDGAWECLSNHETAPVFMVRTTKFLAAALLAARFRVMDPPGFGLMDPPCMGYRRSRGLRVLRVLFL